ncbi:hypothetical protein GIB67_034551 [Kingdonia uniflora]|uniref:Anaphase-promoting complex subunit 7 n=1 Tax=Kingdonia uniflora TaxID=39325 RepID=A0A7J7PB91_9MAGN|nr:hypothetical protein GIB67_034551 [Kingdonia uniflora]
MEVPKDQITTLLDNGFHESAQILGSFLVSSSATNAAEASSPHAKAENLVLLGDALFGQKEYRRAVAKLISLVDLWKGVDKKFESITQNFIWNDSPEFMYKQVLQYCKINPKQSMTSSRNSLSTSNRSSSPNFINVSAINENEMKFKATLCHCALGENGPALAEMEGIPSKARTLRMNLTMGKLYRQAKNGRAAIPCYKDCLRHCPYIFEAICALAELGVSAKDIISSFPQTPNRNGRPPFDHLDSSRWLQRYVEAQCCVASNDYKGCIEIFTELLQRFPSNVHLLLEIAKVEAIIGRNDEAITNLKRYARSIDPYIITYMDEYAMLLKSKSDNFKLNRLLHELLSIDPCKPEIFVILSVMWEKKDERRALAYSEKCLRLDERHVPGHIMKGNLFLSLGRPDAAAIAFKTAQSLRPDLRSYQGLVCSYLALSKTKEALCSAREAYKAMPQSAKALKLVGDVHASNSGGREKAKRFYESALRLEPAYLGAALALAELHVVEGRNSEAVILLEKYIKFWADDSLHLKINPENDAAKKGLERVEKQMKGVDPDAPEEDEDNEFDDAEGEQEESEF